MACTPTIWRQGDTFVIYATVLDDDTTPPTPADPDSYDVAAQLRTVDGELVQTFQFNKNVGSFRSVGVDTWGWPLNQRLLFDFKITVGGTAVHSINSTIMVQRSQTQ